MDPASLFDLLARAEQHMVLGKAQIDNQYRIIAYTAGKMRRYRIRIFPGDRVKVELSPYDLDRGRIVFRYR